MPGRAERKAAQQEKLAAMSTGKRIAVVIAGGLAAVVAGLVIGLLFSGEAKVATSVVIGILIMLILGYEYVVAPSRRRSAGGSH